MSKLLEKLERISEGNVQPMGFGAAISKVKISPMLVIASMPAGNPHLTAIAEKEAADALLLVLEHFDKKSENLAKISQAKPEIPWGVSLETISREETEHLIEMGCDFVVFAPAKTPAAVLTEERIGKVLKIDTSMPDSLAKAINRLQVDAVVISPVSQEESPLTVQQLMVYERLAGSTGKHLLAAFPPANSPADIEILWELRVEGVIVDLNVEQPERRLSEIKEAIQKLPASHKKSKEKIRATLPLSMPSEKKEDEEEEEEP